MKDPGEEMAAELELILNWWRKYSPDYLQGGFFGKINNENLPDLSARKGSVLNCRILWTFSAAYRENRNKADLSFADRACDFLLHHSYDHRFGGLFWSVGADGLPADTYKQIYAQAFGIYALSEYSKATANRHALEKALALFDLIEKYSFDPQHGGYIEGLTREWTTRSDQRLSAKEINAPKTMNTHLHLMEGYANLYEVWPNEMLLAKTRDLIRLVLDRIIDPHSSHLQLYFDRQWKPIPGPVSYGHDIEAGWLLCECAAKIKDSTLMQECRSTAVRLTTAAMEGMDDDGGLWYESDPVTGETIRQKHWWPQAEAQIGFYNAWEITGHPAFLEKREQNWRFIQEKIRDAEFGEWIWGTDEGGTKMSGQDKAGLWKGPYHNARCCMELMQRLAKTKSLRQ